MNIKTKSVQAISKQLSLPLFNGKSTVEEPILYFGYRKDKTGNILDPKLVYVDESLVQWTVTHENIIMEEVKQLPKEVRTATPTLKEGKRKDQKTG